MFGRKFRELRKERNMTLKQFSNLIHISQSFLSDIENNRSYPSISNLFGICDTLGVKPEFFFGESRYADSRVSETDMAVRIAYIDKGREILEQLYDIDRLSLQDRTEILDLIKYIKSKNHRQKSDR
jgi:transcriptional regulator with XRE-family HTH domain